MKTVVDRLFNESQRVGTCLLHDGRTIQVGERSYRPARLVYEHHYGALETGQRVYRTCGRKLCINPAHLSVTPKGRRNHAIVATVTTEEKNKVAERWSTLGFPSEAAYLHHLVIKDLNQ